MMPKNKPAWSREELKEKIQLLSRGGGRQAIRSESAEAGPIKLLDECPFEVADANDVSIVSVGADHGDSVVIDVPGHGRYRARLFENFFFVGSKPAKRGRLRKCNRIYVLCSPDCTQAVIEQAITDICAQLDAS